MTPLPPWGPLDFPDKGLRIWISEKTIYWVTLFPQRRHEVPF